MNRDRIRGSKSKWAMGSWPSPKPNSPSPNNLPSPRRDTKIKMFNRCPNSNSKTTTVMKN